MYPVSFNAIAKEFWRTLPLKLDTLCYTAQQWRRHNTGV